MSPTLKIRLLIADDEYSGRYTLDLLLRKQLSERKDIYVDMVSTLEEVSARLTDHFYDLIFLDINFKGVSAFEVVDQIPRASKLVFVTAYGEHVIKAIRKSAFDYLLKPVKEEELSNCLQRFFETQGENVPADLIQIREKGYTRWLKLDEISHVKGQGPYAQIFIGHEQLTIAKTLKSLAPELGEDFIRIHKSFLVNRKFIKAFQRDQLILTNQVCLPVSRNGMKNLDTY
jgi:DNA-binding LytR/AlgR family response regulator